ncbi:MAG TPA: BlaI/MecI/CopY family transcriptional regulator [Caulobacteraceae bacterium]|nr:BlaI/MecI/CopY family transcriptional regulator [Caulobacteraceae bacterium]
MGARIPVTEAESALLDVLWTSGPLPPARLLAEVRARRAWGDATIKTLLGRLMRKKAVRSERDEGRLVYRPLVGRQAYLAAEVNDLVQRLFDGDPDALRAFLDQSVAGEVRPRPRS